MANAIEAEVIGLLEALHIPRDKRLDNCIVEGDSKVLVGVKIRQGGLGDCFIS